MIKHILLPILACLGITSGLQAADVEARCDQLHSVLYAGGDNQPILRIKVQANEAGEKLQKMAFSLAGTSNPGDVRKVTLWTSGSQPFFSPSSGKATESSLTSTGIKAPGIVEFKGEHTLEAGDNYFWLTCNVNERARGNAAIDAACKGIQLQTKNMVPRNASPAGSPRIFPYQCRIMPYYRDSVLAEASSPLTPQHFTLITDIIFFSVGVDAEGNVTGTEADSNFMKGLQKLKKMRGKNAVNIILGVTPNKQVMPAVVADPEKRRKYAGQLAAFAKSNGFGGIDLDWENPTNAEQWYNYALLISDIREELATTGVSGLSISIANAIHYIPATKEVCDQLDFLNNMSYDAGGEHSTMALMTGDIQKCKNTVQLPDYKIIAGLPFYSQEMDHPRDWNQGQGNNTIVGAFPNIKPSQNTFVWPKTGKKHYFNGVNLIQDKVKYVKDQKIGGIMIWAYDRDLPLSKERSLARAIAGILKPVKR